MSTTADAIAARIFELERELADLRFFAGAVRMALQPGTTRSVNGVTYVLNQNHRWTRQQSQSAGNPQRQPNRHPARRPAANNTAGNPQHRKVVGNQPGNQRPSTVSSSLDPTKDANGDGITDMARVGVPAFEVPPPPSQIPRIPGLTGKAKRAESAFAHAFEANPEGMTEKALQLFVGTARPGEPVTFATDDAKNLSGFWNGRKLQKDKARRSQNRATLNTALHQTANAITKRAFLAHLDSLPEGAEIMVTVGGCGAGKGYALKNVPEALELKNRASVVWDSAGDQNATENPWILQEAKKRGLRVSYVYVHSDPYVSWAHPDRGAVKRAQDPEDGRMVDAKVFADSYAIGAKNHSAFAQKHASDPSTTFVFLKNGSPPQLVSGMPPDALNIDRSQLAKFAIDTVQQQQETIPPHVREGALAGTRLWSDL